MKGKKILSILLAGSMVCMCAACSSTGTDTAGKSTETGKSVETGESNADEGADKTGGDVETLSMLTYIDWYGDGMKAVESYIDEHAEELGFRLDIQQIPGGSEGDELVAARSATNDLPDILNYGSVYKYYTACGGEGKVIPMENSSSVAEYDESIINSSWFTMDGQLYGMPFGTAYYYGLYYNKKVLEEAGVETVPTNWDELLEACEKVKDIGKIPVYFSTADTWTTQVFVLSAFSGDYREYGMDSNNFWTAVNSNQIKFADCKNVLDTIVKTKELITAGYVQDTHLSDTYDMAQTTLANGDCAFYGCANTVVSEIASKYPDKAEDIGGTVIPLYDADTNELPMAFPTTLMITAACENPELAQKAIDFMCSAEAQEIYANAQPGVYLNENMNLDVLPALAEQNECKKVASWTPKYEETTLGSYLVDYYVYTKTAEEVMASMDEAFARSAEAAGDEYWTE